MSNDYSLIIKNGNCYINGKLTKVDLALSGNKIKKIGKIDLDSSKVYDATDQVVLPGKPISVFLSLPSIQHEPFLMMRLNLSDMF